MRGGPAPGSADRFLSTAAVVALAVAQPLLDLLGRTPTFFVARAAPTLDVVLVGLVVGLAVPLWFAAVVTLVGRINESAGTWLHAVVLAASTGLLTLAVSGATPAGTAPGWLLVAVAVAVGAAAVVAYHRWGPLRAGLRYAGLAPAVITGWFLVMTPTAQLIWDRPAAATPAAPMTAGPPVVMVVFDEFPLATLIDGEGNLRDDLFPGFARLAADGAWFRNAVSVNDGTAEALTTIVTGVAAPPDSIPSAVAHPDNLFTLLGGGYRVNAIESVTALCPISVCTEGSRLRAPPRARWSALVVDLSVVAAHVLLPEDLTGALPPIDRGWSDFMGDGDGRWAHETRFHREVDAGRTRAMTAFLDGLERPLDQGELRFVHLLLPHYPWSLLPDGRQHGAPAMLPGEMGQVWIDDAWRVEQAYQRHLLQAQYMDLFVTDLVAALEAGGSYDDTLVVMVADHGGAFRPGISRRDITAANVGDVAAVPLFVKRPGPRRGEVSDYRAETVDILPTVAGVLGVEVPWVVDGVDLFGSGLPARTESTVTGRRGGSATFGVEGEEKRDVARYHDGWFGGGGPFALAPESHRDLLGTATPQPAEPAAGVTVSVDQSYPPPDPAAAVVPAFMSGTVEGASGDGQVLAIAFDGRIVAVTRAWQDEGRTRFHAMLPPEALTATSGPDVYLVALNDEGDRALRLLGT